MHPRELVSNVLRYIANALTVVEARSHAASALKSLCVGCRAKMASEPQILEHVVDALENASSAGLEIADRKVRVHVVPLRSPPS
jgi:hypothetical protein